MPEHNFMICPSTHRRRRNVHKLCGQTLHYKRRDGVEAHHSGQGWTTAWFHWLVLADVEKPASWWHHITCFALLNVIKIEEVAVVSGAAMYLLHIQAYKVIKEYPKGKGSFNLFWKCFPSHNQNQLWRSRGEAIVPKIVMWGRTHGQIGQRNEF